MVRTLVAAFVVAYLPGALIFRWPALNRPARAALPADERTFWAIVLSTVWSLTWVLLLAGVGAYSFDRLLALNVGIAVAGVVWQRGRLRYHGEAPRLSWPAIAPALLIYAGLFVFFPPAEYVIGGKDPGTYVNEGIQIDQTGELFIHDPTVAAVPAEFRDLFFPDHQDAFYYSLRFMGFWIPHWDHDVVVGQFPHLLPAAIAIGYALDGVRGALGTVGVWAMLGLLAVYFAGARIFGRWPAFGGALLLAANVIEVWFGRYPNSDVVMQALLFAAVLAFARALEGSQAFFGAVAAGLIAVMLFLRYDALLAFASFGAAAALAPVMRQRVGAVFGPVLILMGLLGFWYLKEPMTGYSAYPLGFTRDQGGWWLVAAALLSIAAARGILRRAAGVRVVRTAVPWLLAVSVPVLALYAYFFRAEGGGLTDFDARAFWTFGAYVTPAVLGASVLAFAVLVVRFFWRDPAFFLTFTTYGIFFFYKTRIVPEHFWITRRFLAVALPGVLLLVAALVSEVTNGQRLTGLVTRWRGEAAGPAARGWLNAVGALLLAAVLVPIGIVFWRASDPVHRHTEYAGLRQQVERLASRIGERDLVLVEGRVGASDVHTFAQPLAYIYRRNVLVLPTALPPKRELEAFVTWGVSRYEHVYFLGGGGTNLLSRHLSAEPVTSDQFMVPEYDAPVNALPAAELRLPAGVRQKEFEYGLYRIRPTDGMPSGPIDLTIGTRDDLHTVRFHSKEGRPGHSLVYRWTRDLSYVVLLGIAEEARTITLWMSNGNRSPRAPAATVEIAIDDRVLGTVTVGPALQPYDVSLPSDIAATAARSPDPVRLSLRVPTWNPAELGEGTDHRDLGVQVTRVQVQ